MARSGQVRVAALVATVAGGLVASCAAVTGLDGYDIVACPDGCEDATPDGLAGDRDRVAPGDAANAPPKDARSDAQPVNDADADASADVVTDARDADADVAVACVNGFFCPASGTCVSSCYGSCGATPVECASSRTCIAVDTCATACAEKLHCWRCSFGGNTPTNARCVNVGMGCAFGGTTACDCDNGNVAACRSADQVCYQGNCVPCGVSNTNNRSCKGGGECTQALAMCQ